MVGNVVSLSHTCTVDWSGEAAANGSTVPGSSAGQELPSEDYRGCFALLRYPLLDQDAYSPKCWEWHHLRGMSPCHQQLVFIN